MNFCEDLLITVSLIVFERNDIMLQWKNGIENTSFTAENGNINDADSPKQVSVMKFHYAVFLLRSNVESLST